MRARGRTEEKFRELRARSEAALIPFIVAGDPDLRYTGMLVDELEARGADLIELGVPFSDPMADGPANQRSLARGLACGASLSAILAMVSELRAHTRIPIVLFGYYNPLLRYGCERLCFDAARAGIDGLLVVDLPPEEAEELAGPARQSGLDLIRLLAPTTPAERMRKIARSATGFLYYVSVPGVTGVRQALPEGLGQQISELRSLTDLPIGVGFGISTAEQAACVASFADAVIVGSALSLLIDNKGKSGAMIEAVGSLAAAMKRAMKGARAQGLATGR